jgi:hypothetical protein
MPRKIIVFIICFCFIFEQIGFAQIAPQLGVPAYLSNLAPVADRFRPVQLRSLSFNPTLNNYDLLLDKGDTKDLQSSQLEDTVKTLMEYFKIGLALPNSMFWVNLRPDAPDQVIDPYVEKTDLGRIFLEADLQLKKDIARFTSPDTAEGKKYWDQVYVYAEKLFGPQDMEIPTFTRPWIVPGEIILRESSGEAFIYKASLKVMLEQDYLKDSSFYKFDDVRLKQINEYSSQLIRQLIIPKLTREVNSSKRYAALRQVYYSLILAQWFKAQHQDGFGIDGKELAGLASKTAWSKDGYFKAYQKSFQQGEYKKEESFNTSAGVTVRQYFSGGIVLDGGAFMQHIFGFTNFAFRDSFTEIRVNTDGGANRIIQGGGLTQGQLDVFSGHK